MSTKHSAGPWTTKQLPVAIGVFDADGRLVATVSAGITKTAVRCQATLTLAKVDMALQRLQVQVEVQA